MVPAFTAFRSAKEEPDYVPAASPQVRRSPSLWPPRPAHGCPAGSSLGKTASLGTHCDRPRSTRFRAGVKVKDVTTPVPHVLLFAIAPRTHAIWQC